MMRVKVAAMSNLRVFSAALLLGSALAACSSGSSSSTSSSTGGTSSATAGAAGGAKTIGVSIQDSEAQFYQQMQAGMQSEAQKYGYTISFVDANRDNARQQQQVEDFISRHVDAIVLTPYDSKAIGSAIVEANKANIPVFTADIANASKQGAVVAHVASNNEQGGQQAGMLMCKALPQGGSVAILNQPEVTSVQDRVKGFKEALAQHCPSVKVVADTDSNGTRTKASNDMSDVLQAHADLKGVFGINDDSALGAVTAIQAAGKNGITVIGYDASPEARKAIANGSMFGDAIQHPDQIGKLTIDAIHDYFNGKKVAKTYAVPVGTYTKADAKNAAGK